MLRQHTHFLEVQSTVHEAITKGLLVERFDHEVFNSYKLYKTTN